jgi:hypothetical protein
MKYANRYALLALLALAAGPALAQNTVTLGASVTSGNGSITTDVSWSTNPPLTTGTPCTATGHPSWAGAKAGSGTQTITIATSGTLQLQLTCTFPGDSIVTFTWTPATQNTDGSAYAQAQRGITRIRHTFNPTLSTTAPLPTCNSGGVTCVDLSDMTATRPSMHTVTGVSQTGTLRGYATHVNASGAESAASNAATKAFSGTVPVTQSVAITVNPVPGAPATFGAQ